MSALGPVTGTRYVAAATVRCPILGIEAMGAYWRLDLRAPAVVDATRPGQFVAIAVGDGLGMPLRRFFSVLSTDAATGVIQILLAVHNPGTRWLSQRRPGDELDLLGPLGRPFPDADPDSDIALIAGGHGVAALYTFALASAARGARVHVVLGAASARKLFGARLFEPVATTLSVFTDDGGLGTRGRVTDALDALLGRGVSAIYACGPMPMLAAVGRRAAQVSTPCWVAAEVPMACGIGVCMTCVLPISDGGGRTEMVRACVDGPVIRADRIRWDQLSRIPPDCVGAPRRP